VYGVLGMKLQLVPVLALAFLAGVLGWRAAARRRSRSFFEQPVGMSDRRFAAIKWTRRFLRKLGIALLCALGGAFGGWVLAVLLRLH